MGRSMRLAPVPVVIAPKSLATAFTSDSSTWVTQEAIAYQINITTANSSGQFYLQTSIDGVSYVDVGPCGTAAGANDTILVEYEQSGSYLTRIRYAPSVAGTGTCEILVSAKAVGA